MLLPRLDAHLENPGKSIKKNDCLLSIVHYCSEQYMCFKWQFYRRLKIITIVENAFL